MEVKRTYVGWKEIAGRLEVKERTARDWAANHGLPVVVRVDVIRLEEARLVVWLERADIPYPAYREARGRKGRRVPQAA